MLVERPTLSNLCILACLICASLLTFKRRDTASSFLDTVQTTQLKGLAILLVVIGHLWVHVTTKAAVPILGGYSVSVFLIMSGYGLTLSVKRKGINDFFRSRVSRVMLPYWIATLVWLSLDIFLLDKSYSNFELFMTLIGVNISRHVVRIDYVRWFITLLLIWYIIFYISHRTMAPSRSVYLQLFIGFVLCIFNLAGLFPVGKTYQIIAFPIGCLLAHFIEQLRPLVSTKRLLVAFAISAVVMIIAGPIMIEFKELGGGLAPMLKRALFENLFSLAFFVVLTVILSAFGSYCSQFLWYCGIISYELFLIHGPVLIKYNMVFPLMPQTDIVVTFTLLSVIMIFMASIFRFVLQQAYLIADHKRNN